MIMINKDALFPSSPSSSSASCKSCGHPEDQKLAPKSSCLDPDQRLSCSKLSSALPAANTHKVAAAAERPEPLSCIHNSSSSSSSKYYKYERVFRYFDKDEDGRISPSELCACLATLKEEISMEEAEAVVESADSDGDGLLSLEEFIGLVEVDEGTSVGEEAKKKDLRAAFGMYEETDGRRCITPKSLKRMLSRLGESKTMEECRAMIRRFDLNGDGVLSFDEFVVMMK